MRILLNAVGERDAASSIFANPNTTNKTKMTNEGLSSCNYMVGVRRENDESLGSYIGARKLMCFL